MVRPPGSACAQYGQAGSAESAGSVSLAASGVALRLASYAAKASCSALACRISVIGSGIGEPGGVAVEEAGGATECLVGVAPLTRAPGLSGVGARRSMFVSPASTRVIPAVETRSLVCAYVRSTVRSGFGVSSSALRSSCMRSSLKSSERSPEMSRMSPCR